MSLTRNHPQKLVLFEFSNKQNVKEWEVQGLWMYLQCIVSYLKSSNMMLSYCFFIDRKLYSCLFSNPISPGASCTKECKTVSMKVFDGEKFCSWHATQIFRCIKLCRQVTPPLNSMQSYLHFHLHFHVICLKIILE